MVRYYSIDGQKGRKLEPKRLGPRLLTRITQHGLSGCIREIHGMGEGKRYYMNDIMLYYEREPVTIAAGVQLVMLVSGTTPVVVSNTRIRTERIGGRALILPF